MRCRQCQAENRDGAHFFRECGGRLERARERAQAGDGPSRAAPPARRRPRRRPGEQPRARAPTRLTTAEARASPCAAKAGPHNGLTSRFGPEHFGHHQRSHDQRTTDAHGPAAPPSGGAVRPFAAKASIRPLMSGATRSTSSVSSLRASSGNSRGSVRSRRIRSSRAAAPPA